MNSDELWDGADRLQRTIDSLVTDDPECKAVLTRYDKLGRRTSRVMPDGSLAYLYDRLGRVGKRVGTTNTFYLIDNLNPSGWPQVLAEYSSVTTSVAPSVSYVYGLSFISERQSNGTNSYYGLDGQGSVRFLVEWTGGVLTDNFDFDGYGMLLARSGASTPNKYLYTGQQWDPDLGMYYLRARFYRPNDGRFWGMDTYNGALSDPASLHKYLYCHDMPVGRSDPGGHWDTMQISALMGQITAMATRVLPGIAAGLKYADRIARGAERVLTLAETLVAEGGTLIANEMRVADAAGKVMGRFRADLIVELPNKVTAL